MTYKGKVSKDSVFDRRAPKPTDSMSSSAGPCATSSLPVVIGVLILHVLTVVSGTPLQQTLQATRQPSLDDQVASGSCVQTHSKVKTKVQCAMLCASHKVCASFVFNRDEAVCVTCTGDCGSQNLTTAPGYRFYQMTSSVRISAPCSDVCSNGANCYNASLGRVTWVSTGAAGVWAITSDYYVLHRTGTIGDPSSYGTAWIREPNMRLESIDVGSDHMMGSSNTGIHHIYGSSAHQPLGQYLVQDISSTDCIGVTRSPAGSVWVLHNSHVLYRFYGGNNLVQVGTDIQHADAGPSGLWVVTTAQNVFHREGTYGDNGSEGTGWLMVDGLLDNISCGRDVIIGVNFKGYLWRRNNIGASTPAGAGWTLLATGVAQAEVYEDVLWVVDPDGRVMHMRLNGTG